MNQNSIPALPNLPQSRYENIFNVYQDSNNNYFYNLLQTVILPDNLPAGYFTTYSVEPEDTLPFISYKMYKRIDLWWIIANINKIDNPTVTLQPPLKLKIPNINVVQTILSNI
jgi:nucleoid-associated protein YgaU